MVTGECRVMSPRCPSLIHRHGTMSSKRVCVLRDAPLSKCLRLKQRVMHPCNVLGSCLDKCSVEGPGFLITVNSPSVPCRISTSVASNMNIYIYLLQRVINEAPRWYLLSGAHLVNHRIPLSTDTNLQFHWTRWRLGNCGRNSSGLKRPPRSSRLILWCCKWLEFMPLC